MSILRMQDAFLSRANKPPNLGIVRGGWGIAAAESQMRRLFGPMGTSVQQDGLMAKENNKMTPPPSVAEDFEARAAYS